MGYTKLKALGPMLDTSLPCPHPLSISHSLNGSIPGQHLTPAVQTQAYGIGKCFLPTEHTSASCPSFKSTAFHEVPLPPGSPTPLTMTVFSSITPCSHPTVIVTTAQSSSFCVCLSQCPVYLSRVLTGSSSFLCSWCLETWSTLDAWMRSVK